MADQAFNPAVDFIVKEEKGTNYVLAGLFALLFLYGVGNAAYYNFRQIDYQNIVLAFAIIPVILFIRKGNNPKAHIRVNRKGIYEQEILVTDWAHFIKAFILEKQEKRIYQINDIFYLVIEYQSPKKGIGKRRKIRLTNTQNKSEEEIIVAIRQFLNNYRSGNV